MNDVAHACGAIAPKVAVQLEHVHIGRRCEHTNPVHICAILTRKFEIFAVEKYGR